MTRTLVPFFDIKVLEAPVACSTQTGPCSPSYFYPQRLLRRAAEPAELVGLNSESEQTYSSLQKTGENFKRRKNLFVTKFLTKKA